MKRGTLDCLRQSRIRIIFHPLWNPFSINRWTNSTVRWWFYGLLIPSITPSLYFFQLWVLGLSLMSSMVEHDGPPISWWTIDHLCIPTLGYISSSFLQLPKLQSAATIYGPPMAFVGHFFTLFQLPSAFYSWKTFLQNKHKYILKNTTKSL